MEFRASFFVFVFMLCAISARHLHDGLKRQYLHHLDRVERAKRHHLKFSCSVPKETIVPVNEVTFTNPMLANEIISPSSTVLHRCESCSGCYMQPGYSCMAQTSEIVNLTFCVISGSKTEYRTGTAQNHTSCWCQPLTSQPK